MIRELNNLELKKNQRGTVEFGWIFSIIVGAMILFFAFYFVGTKLMQKQGMDELVSTQTLDVLYTPFSYVGSVAEASASVASLGETTTLQIECSDITGSDFLGYNEISTYSFSKGVKNEAPPKRAYDKYIFSEGGAEKLFFVMSKPLNMPWRIADLVYTFPNNQTYCFDKNTPTNIRNEFQGLENSSETKHFFFGDITPEIKSKCIDVCFGTDGCDIKVTSLKNSNYALGYTSKNNKKMYYYGNALLYAALFSSPELYECNLKRLASRASIQRDLYIEKDKALKQKQCYSLFSLGPLGTSFESLKTARMTDAIAMENLFSAIRTNSELLNNQNRGADCALY